MRPWNPDYLPLYKAVNKTMHKTRYTTPDALLKGEQELFGSLLSNRFDHPTAPPFHTRYCDLTLVPAPYTLPEGNIPFSTPVAGSILTSANASTKATITALHDLPGYLEQLQQK
ncbi:Hypothetical protein GSB_150827 [Giardia duodenalis]|uniref:Uncharacterized protein n=1 Tax=Giardia intestinalis TaxID=5741 RepID=V6U4G0_GIAIN|nr:Hypothetical protein GSB_150827 [Giardia intestinalis]